ncbi:MAG: fibronectin type III domain-containing protein, partial [Candidatus Poribacteria bacterium]|nr:fibronectin type III domain-containing protein [Candidatus Poribacteria bacterium]
HVERRTGTSGAWGNRQTVSGTSATLSGLTNGHEYQVRVRTVNAEGTSGWSAAMEVSGPPATPTNVVVRNATETEYDNRASATVLYVLFDNWDGAQDYSNSDTSYRWFYANWSSQTGANHYRVSIEAPASGHSTEDIVDTSLASQQNTTTTTILIAIIAYQEETYDGGKSEYIFNNQFYLKVASVSTSVGQSPYTPNRSYSLAGYDPLQQ